MPDTKITWRFAMVSKCFDVKFHLDKTFILCCYEWKFPWSDSLPVLGKQLMNMLWLKSRYFGLKANVTQLKFLKTFFQSHFISNKIHQVLKIVFNEIQFNFRRKASLWIYVQNLMRKTLQSLDMVMEIRGIEFYSKNICSKSGFIRGNVNGVTDCLHNGW